MPARPAGTKRGSGRNGASSAAERRIIEQILGGFSQATKAATQAYQDLDAAYNIAASFDPRASFRAPREEAQRIARGLHSSCAAARNVVEQIVNHVVGPGFAIAFEDAQLDAVYQSEARRLRLRQRYREMVRRNERDGECLQVRVDRNTAPWGLKFLEPAQLATPIGLSHANGDAVIDGVHLLDADDPESIIGYYIDGEEYGASRVFHIKALDCDLNDVRGYPTLVEAKRTFERYERFLAARELLNIFRSAIVLFRSHKGATQADLDAFVVNQVRQGLIKRGGNRSDVNIAEVLPGTIIDHSDQVGYEFKQPATGAAEAEVDARMMRLYGATYFQLAEYMYSADASNANYASTAVAESPAVKAMEARQAAYGDEITRFLRWLDPRFADPIVTFPQIVSRDFVGATSAYRLMWESQALSTQTWQERSGIDPSVESGRLAAEGKV